jgi:Spy/CpxP family protein refolding chaperone
MKAKNQAISGKFILTATLILCLAVASLAAAQGPGHGKGRFGQRGPGYGEGPEARLEMMAKRLDLSEEQIASIKAIQEKNRDKMIEMRKDLMRLRNEMQGEMLKDEPSERTVLDLNKKIGDLKTEMKAMRLKTRLAVRDELTEEQQDKMLMMKGMQGRGMQGPGAGHGCRPGGRCGGHGAGHGRCQ